MNWHPGIKHTVNNGITGRRGSMASASSNARGGIVLPQWLLVVICASFLTVATAVAAAAISTWARAQSNLESIQRHETRLQRLEDAQLAVAKMQADVATTKGISEDTNNRLNRFFEEAVRQRGSR